MAFGYWLIRWRCQAGFSIWEVMEKMNMEYARLDALEREAVEPYAYEMVQFSELYGVPLETVVRAAAGVINL